MSDITEIDAVTQETVIRKMNDVEFAQRKTDLEANALRAQAEATALAEADSARTAAVAKLAKLGLTVDDLQALGLGGN